MRLSILRSTLTLRTQSILFACVAVACFTVACSEPALAQEAPKGKPIFDGKSLQGWSGLSSLWRVEEGAITGETKADDPIKNNTFLVYEKPVKDFELTCQFKIAGGNSGIQYRSKVLDQEKFIVGGYQADIDSKSRYMGINYEEKGRGILAERGEITKWVPGEKNKTMVGSCGEGDALKARFQAEGWNTYKIVAKGILLQHFINGHLMSEVLDEQADKRASEGVIALQLHVGPAMKVQFKDMLLSE
jgi:hypothetical protein